MDALTQMDPNAQMQLLQYLPGVLKVASNIPGFLFGYVVTLFVILFFYGTSYFRLHIAPIAGFHFVALMMLRFIIPSFLQLYETVVIARRRAKEVASFSSEIKKKAAALEKHSHLD